MTRFTYNFLKPVSLLLVIVFLFQCCMVYDKRPVSIEKAINVNPKKVRYIKVDMFGNKKLILNSMYYNDNQLYGVLAKYKKGNSIVKINEDQIIRIRLYNNAKSISGTVFLVIGCLGLIVAGLYAWAISGLQWTN